MAAKDKKGPTETLANVVLDSDKELDQEIPGATFALVGLTYLLILAMVLIGFALFFWIS